MPEKPMPQWQSFAKHLRRLRQQRGFSLGDMSERTGYADSTISKFERALRAPKRDFVDSVEAVFRTDGDLIRRWQGAKRTESDPEWHRKVVTSEERATAIKMWCPLLVPGFMQTREYARSVFRDGSPLDTEEEVERLVELRVNRLETLRSLRNPRLLAIISEAVIRAQVGSAASMSKQLQHLLVLGRQQNVQLLVLPTNVPYYGGASGPFRLLTFEDHTTVVEVEHASGGEILEGETVTRLTTVWEDLQTWALPPTASHELITQAIGDLE